MARPKLTPRKLPVQDRSRATVEALLEATADILVRHGHAGLTTNKIAERAGVNIASLYQYFASKEAIVAELQRRHVAEQRQATREALERHRGSGLEATVRTLVSMGVAAHAVAPRLHHALGEMLPARRSRASDRGDPLVEAAKQTFAAQLPAHVDPELVFWIVDTVAHAVIHGAVIERPDDLRAGRVTDELVALLLGYLERPRPAGASRASSPCSRS